MADETEKTREELIEEVKYLKRELARSERTVAAGEWTLKSLITFGKRIFLGSSLDDRLKEWLEAVEGGNLLPTNETANVLAAIIRRRMGFYIFAIIGTLGALSTTGLLIWQNTLVRQQIRQQAEQDTLSRRAQLIQILYDKTCVDETQSQKNSKGQVQEIMAEKCTPIADARSRGEAAKLFISIERDAGIIPDLSGSLLSNTNLEGVNLAGANLSGADLNQAFLYEVDLRGADLSGADLSESNLVSSNLSQASLVGSNLRGTDFSGTKLSYTDLGDTNLRKANLSDVNLSEAYLGGADLSGAYLLGADLSELGIYVNEIDFSATTYDSYTIFPESFEIREDMCFIDKHDLDSCHPELFWGREENQLND